MSEVELTGRLICADQEEAQIVTRFLPRHVELTRAEAGCLHFEVVRTEDPLVWWVVERFADRAAFDAHQARVRASDWVCASAGIRRDYVTREKFGSASEPDVGSQQASAEFRSRWLP